MNNRQEKNSHITRRGAVVIGAVATAAAATAALGLMEASHQRPEHRSRSEILQNMSNIRNAKVVERSTVYLKSDVALRKSMEINDSNPKIGDFSSNVVRRVPDGHYLVLTNPVLEHDRDGNEWYMALEPDTHPTTLKDKAEVTVYIAKSILEKKDPTSIAIDPAKDGRPIEYVPVEYVGGMIEGTHTDIIFPMTSTLNDDMGK